MRLDDGVGYDDPKPARHDDLGHDHQVGVTAGPRWRCAWLVVAAGVVAALGLLVVITHDGASAAGSLAVANTTAGHSGSAEVTTHKSTPSAVKPSTSPAGNDASQVATIGATGNVAAAPTRVATVFMRGWLDHAPKSRRAQLEQSATAQLVTGLMQTDPAAIPKTTVTSTTIVGQSATAAEFTIVLADNGRLGLLMAADPQAPYGWWVVSVTEGTS